MPTLAYDIDATPYAGRLTGRVLVGRRLSHGVVLADPGVSRLHAWVDPAPDGTWTVTDAGSQSGTFVNDQPVYQHALHDGDVIRVGHTRVTFRATTDDLPPGAEGVVLTPVPGDRVHTSGVLFDCACGAPIWAGNNLVGKRGRCRHCKRQIVVPAPVADRSPPSAQPVAPPPPIDDLSTPATARRLQCGVCHALIAGSEDMTACPECDTTYHAECWTENYGCSTYGCGQVNALNPNAVPVARPSDLTAGDAPADEVDADQPTDAEPAAAPTRPAATPTTTWP